MQIDRSALPEYDSEINITITTLLDGRYDYALVSFTEWGEKVHWKHAENAADLAELHAEALAKYPGSGYAKG